MPDTAGVPGVFTINQDLSVSPGGIIVAKKRLPTAIAFTRQAGDPFQDAGDAVTVQTPSGLILYHYAGAFVVVGAGQYSASARVFLDGNPLPLFGNLASNQTDTEEAMSGSTNQIAAFTDPYAGSFQVNTPGNLGVVGSFTLGNRGINFSHGMANTGWSFNPPTALPGAGLSIVCTPGPHTLQVKWQVGVNIQSATNITVTDSQQIAIGL